MELRVSRWDPEASQLTAASRVGTCAWARGSQQRPGRPRRGRRTLNASVNLGSKRTDEDCARQ
eukprot:7071134-Alexandrium_andersonii.AAC.1